MLALAATAVLFASCAQRVTIANLLAPPIPVEADLENAREALSELGRGRKEAREKYNESVSRIIQHGDLQKNEDATAASLTFSDQSIPLVDGMGEITDLATVERIAPASPMVIGGFRERITVDGVGAPLVLRFPAEGYSPEEGLFQPATAVLDFEGPNASPRLVVHDTLANAKTTLTSSGVSRTLEADFTAPLASRFAAEERQRISLAAMLKSDKFDDKLGLSKLDTTYPHKIPVVFVHGLKSTPSTWRDTVNELRADPVIRERYEFWTFGYTTGAPIPYSAMKLREALKGMATFRQQLEAPTDNIVIIGHSMGGLLTRLMTESSGDEVWFRFFNEPVEELPLPEDEREMIKKMAYFEPLPFVKRAVFIATPHGGSQMAEDPIGRIFSDLIQLPSQLLTLSTSIVSESVYSLTPFGQAILGKRIPTSIDMLEADSELLQRLKSTPLNPNVSFHSIIGDIGGKETPTGTDGIVPVESAHLEGVDSELIIQSAHRAHQKPEAVAELRRILRLHVGSIPAPERE